MSPETPAPTIDDAPGAAGDAMEVDASTGQPSQAATDGTNGIQGPSGDLPATASPENKAATASQSIATLPATDEPAEQTQSTSKPLCGICNDNPGKYKCTRCKLPFCSVACNKVHRENHPPDPDPPADADSNRTNVASADTALPASTAPDPRNPFSSLDTSEHLQYLFKRYPSLPQQLRAIGAQTDPPAEAQPGSLKEALLAQAAAVGKPRKEQWNHDVGIRKGKDALRKARRAEGDVGRGIREYTELIVHLTSQDARNREAEALLRSQAAQRDTDLIRKLLEEEKR